MSLNYRAKAIIQWTSILVHLQGLSHLGLVRPFNVCLTARGIGALVPLASCIGAWAEIGFQITGCLAHSVSYRSYSVSACHLLTSSSHLHTPQGHRQDTACSRLTTCQSCHLMKDSTASHCTASELTEFTERAPWLSVSVFLIDGPGGSSLPPALWHGTSLRQLDQAAKPAIGHRLSYPVLLHGSCSPHAYHLSDLALRRAALSEAGKGALHRHAGDFILATGLFNKSLAMEHMAALVVMEQNVSLPSECERHHCHSSRAAF